VGGNGGENNNASLVQVSGGTFVMNEGAKITGNTATSGGGGVNISGTFSMHDGVISGNNGGGVFAGFGGTFSMHGGEIFGNVATGWNSGGGVNISNGGTFQMSNGVIYGNEEEHEERRNTATGGNGVAALRNEGTAQRGTLNADEMFNSLGTLYNSNRTYV
jgi:hypothetical protein